MTVDVDVADGRRVHQQHPGRRRVVVAGDESAERERDADGRRAAAGDRRQGVPPTNLHGGGTPSTVTLTLTNPNGVALTSASLTDTLPVAIARDRGARQRLDHLRRGDGVDRREPAPR